MAKPPQRPAEAVGRRTALERAADNEASAKQRQDTTPKLHPKATHMGRGDAARQLRNEKGENTQTDALQGAACTLRAGRSHGARFGATWEACAAAHHFAHVAVGATSPSRSAIKERESDSTLTQTSLRAPRVRAMCERGAEATGASFA